MSANGHLLDSELTVVQGSGANAICLNLPTAAIFRLMQRDAAKDGVTITLVNSYRGAAGYRPRDVQLDMRARPWLYNIGTGFGLPGLPSEHGFGNCMDFDQGLAWVEAHPEYGITFPIATDHNHGRYDGITLAGEIGELINMEEDDMFSDADRAELTRAANVQPLHARVIRNTATGDIVMLHPAGITIIGQPLMPDIASANGQALMAGQTLNAQGGYWIDLAADRFGWELARHAALLGALDDHIRQVVGAASPSGSPVISDEVKALIPTPGQIADELAARLKS